MGMWLNKKQKTKWKKLNEEMSVAIHFVAWKILSLSLCIFHNYEFTSQFAPSLEQIARRGKSNTP